jgi:prepilin peptidase CpaA
MFAPSQAMAGSWFAPGALIITVLAVVWDLAVRRIPNAITMTAMAGGLAGHAILHGTHGIAWSAAGLAVGIGLLLLPVLMGGMGGGDLKLLGALGAILGPRTVFEIALIAGVAGGVMALAAAFYRGVAGAAFRRAMGLCLFWRRSGQAEAPSAPADLGSIPYGVAIGMGTWICLLGGGLR